MSQARIRLIPHTDLAKCHDKLQESLRVLFAARWDWLADLNNPAAPISVRLRRKLSLPMEPGQDHDDDQGVEIGTIWT